MYCSDASVCACLLGDFDCRSIQLERLGPTVLWLDVQHTISKSQIQNLSPPISSSPLCLCEVSNKKYLALSISSGVCFSIKGKQVSPSTL